MKKFKRKRQRHEVRLAGGFAAGGKTVIWEVALKTHGREYPVLTLPKGRAGGWYRVHGSEINVESLTEGDGIHWGWQTYRAVSITETGIANGALVLSVTEVNSRHLEEGLHLDRRVDSYFPNTQVSSVAVNQTLTCSMLGSVQVVALVAGSEGLPWAEDSDTYGCIDNGFPSVSDEDEQGTYWIGVIRNT